MHRQSELRVDRLGLRRHQERMCGGEFDRERSQVHHSLPDGVRSVSCASHLRGFAVATAKFLLPTEHLSDDAPCRPDCRDLPRQLLEQCKRIGMHSHMFGGVHQGCRCNLHCWEMVSATLPPESLQCSAHGSRKWDLHRWLRRHAEFPEAGFALPADVQAWLRTNFGVRGDCGANSRELPCFEQLRVRAGHLRGRGAAVRASVGRHRRKLHAVNALQFHREFLQLDRRGLRVRGRLRSDRSHLP